MVVNFGKSENSTAAVSHNKSKSILRYRENGESVVDFYKDYIASSSFTSKPKFGIEGYTIGKQKNMDNPNINIQIWKNQSTNKVGKKTYLDDIMNFSKKHFSSELRK